jgi:hypothetical protein
MMVPLRRALIVKEHGVLPYPEGTACADVLIAGERGGELARTVFMGLGVGALWKSVSWIVQIFRTAIGYTMSRESFFPNATLNVDISPEYLGVGYVIGPRIAGVMFAGGVLSWMVLLPLLSILGNYMPGPFPVPAAVSGSRNDTSSSGARIRYGRRRRVAAASSPGPHDPDDRVLSASVKTAQGYTGVEDPDRARYPAHGRAGRLAPAGRVSGGRAEPADPG